MNNLARFHPAAPEPALVMDAAFQIGDVIRWRGRIMPHTDMDKTRLTNIMASATENKMAPVFTLQDGESLDGWAKIVRSRRVIPDNNQTLASTLREMKLEEVASGLYMDDASSTWSVERSGGNILITRQLDADEIDDIIEKASSMGSKPDFRSPIERTGTPAGILWVDEDGECASGLAYSTAKGHPAMLRTFPITNDGPSRRSTMVHPLNVVIANSVDVEVDGANPDAEISAKLWRQFGGSHPFLDDLWNTALQHAVQ